MGFEPRSKWGTLGSKRVLSPLYHPDNCIKVAKKGALRHLTKRSSLRGRTKVAKVGPPRARVKSAKVRPTPYVYYPRLGWLRVIKFPVAWS